MRFTATSIISLCCAVFPLAGIAAESPRGDQARLTLGVPLYIYHLDSRGGGREWNDGWLHNEGVFADVTWPVWSISPSTKMRLGITGGVFDNSISRTSVFGGGVAEIETQVSPSWAFSLGSYAGAITGYEWEVSPALRHMSEHPTPLASA